MTARVIVSELADADTERILEVLTQEAGHQTAVRYAEAFETLYDRLAAYPEGYQCRPSLGSNVRVAVVRPYLVIYRYAEGSGEVGVIRIVHGHRDITRRLLAGG